MDSWEGFRSHVSHLECSATGDRYSAGEFHNLSPRESRCLSATTSSRLGAPSAIRACRRAPDFWRYRELLPIRKAADVVSLGEEITPLVPLAETSRRIGGGEVMVKDEGRLPTASFKARGMAVAISMAKSFGVRQMALPTVGSGAPRSPLIAAAHPSRCSSSAPRICLR